MSGSRQRQSQQQDLVARHVNTISVVAAALIAGSRAVTPLFCCRLAGGGCVCAGGGGMAAAGVLDHLLCAVLKW
jgi:hypothetical protein